MDNPTLSAASPTAFCACAAAKAALIMLLSQKPIKSVAVQIPDAATRRFFRKTVPCQPAVPVARSATKTIGNVMRSAGFPLQPKFP